ncbi:uncharacterized protein LTR77_003095 [Saxophila tyrrhenica]|uniref:Ubiquitin carboxyl-terminal hydrolase n=1 Tax=Saxophila tyrrhenica TaxID=1690608 RepID=A0AAV9PKP1_9PEZI|nr:hypothetical protein LTR77_003095 [Saxophila tyrrhenica]
MPPKKGTKRKASNGSLANGEMDLLPPDRATWPGWVEMESEPAFFNVMLNEMGVQGVKVQEVYGLDEEMLAILPQPVHALIFLFRYRDVDETESEKGTECPEHVWFANQIPDFACASVALLNIVNNIKGLRMGRELRDFKDFTKDMDPLSRGDAIDSFEFVKKIHNSFARENDLLIADVHYRQKSMKAKKRQAVAKARETREAKKEGSTPLKPQPVNGRATATPERASTRTRKQPASIANGTASPASSPLSDPPESDADFETPSKAKKHAQETNGDRRRSARQPKPRKDVFATKAPPPDNDEQEGFHFIAYMPIQGHVWRMDGLDSFPQDMGEFDKTVDGGWMNVAQPALQTRMAMYEGADIEFNLMAVVHDPVVKDRNELARNIKALQAVDEELTKSFEEWRDLDGAETKKDVITGFSSEVSITQTDIDDAALTKELLEELKQDDNLMRLVEMRKKIICEQAPLRGAVRDATETAKGDEEKARHRRHDYGKFVRSWMGALAENELVTDLIEDAT